MATFTQDDVDYLKSHGNDECAKTWLGLWDPKRAVHQDQRELMIDKYERKRYYLEPASPLKSLTNAVSLKTGSVAAAGAAAEVATASGARASGAASTTTSSGSSSYKSNGDGHIELLNVSNGFGLNGHNNKHQFRQQGANAERSFQLTPPSTQRTTMNGLHKAVTGAAGSGKATSAISRPQQQQHQKNGYSHLQDAFMQKCNKNINNNVSNNNHNELNVLHMTTSRMSDSSSATSVNGFGADADFVADFGSANIFDATTANQRGNMSSPPKLNGAGGGAISSNGYARIQPLKKQQQQQQHQQQQQYHLLNGHGQMNGNSSQSESFGNATSENFADFEHAPIFNAAANYNFVRKTVLKRCAGGQQSDSENPKTPTASIESPHSRQYQSPSVKSDSAAESMLDKNFYADIRQATTHSEFSDENANSFSFSTSAGRSTSQAGSQRQSKDPTVSPPLSLQTRGTEEANNFITQNTVTELTSQLNSPHMFNFSPSAAEYSGTYPQVRCTELTVMSNQNQDPNQDQAGYCGGNIPQIDWSQYANNTPRWPPESSCMLGTRGGGHTHAEQIEEAASKSQFATPMNQEQLQIPPTCCPQVKFCAPQICPLPYFPPPCSPRVCPLPARCPSDAFQNVNGEQQQPDVTVAGLSYGPIPQQTVLNAAQNRPQNGGDTQAEACLQTTPSYSTLYNRSYCQPSVFAYRNPFVQQTPAQPAPMPLPPECYNPFHPYCISGSYPKGCMPSNSIPVWDPIIDPSCNMHSPYNNCFCNNWCLPIPNNHLRSVNTQRYNSQNNNNNNKLSSTPSEDRYAALKDLDEQLRESKAAATVVAAYGAETFGNNGASNVVNPFKHQQANPFQAAIHGAPPTTTQNYFGEMTVISNGNGTPSQLPTTNTHFYNYNNDYGNAASTAATATAMFPHTVMAAGPSACGFSLGALQPTAIAATGAGGGGAFNNPFAASGAMNANNPFL